MTLKEFLHERLHTTQWSRSAYVFVSSSYSSLIASYLLQGIKKNYSFINFSFADRSFGDFENSAHTTFLGQTSVIWLGNCSEYETSIKKKLIPFLKEYNGPHTLIGFLADKEYSEEEPNALVYDKHFDFTTVSYFIEYCTGKKLNQESSAIQGYTFEQTIIFYLYTFLINDPQLLIKEGWAEKLFVKETSLFELSKLFFAKKKEAFFALWKKLETAYSPIFWTVFWSEQLWHAFLVVHLRNKKEFNTAKQFQGRLPFSFLQYDWQNYTPAELYKAHHYVTQIDRNLKLSASPESIEMLYYTFFAKKL